MQLNQSIPNNQKVKYLYQPWQEEVAGPQFSEIAELADRLGFGRLTVGEHFAIPQEHLDLSGAHYVDATTALAYLAGSTNRIRLASNISIVPLRDPVVQAKQWSVLDWLSGGRADLIVGVGWLKEEFDFLGVDFASRGRRTDEYIEAMLAIWNDDLATYHGQFVDFTDLAAEPKPVQPGGIPLWFAGDVPKTFERVARWGVGWSPHQVQPQQIPECLDRITSHPAYHGQQISVFYNLALLRLGEGHLAKQDDHDFDTWNAQELIDQIMWVEQFGVTEVATPQPALKSYSHFLERLHWLGEDVIPHIA